MCTCECQWKLCGCVYVDMSMMMLIHACEHNYILVCDIYSLKICLMLACIATFK